MAGTPGSVGVSSADDVLEMSGVRGVGGVYEMCCVCLGGERIGFGPYQCCRNMGSVGRMSVFGVRWYGIMSVCVVSLDYLCRWQVYIVQGGYLVILGAPSVQSCCTLSISAS